MAVEVGFEFLAEKPQRRQHRVGRGFAEPAEAGAAHHVGKCDQFLQIVGFGFSFADMFEDIEHAAGADAAKRAFAA